jgi:hypothetical protein
MYEISMCSDADALEVLGSDAGRLSSRGDTGCKPSLSSEDGSDREPALSPDPPYRAGAGRPDARRRPLTRPLLCAFLQSRSIGRLRKLLTIIALVTFAAAPGAGHSA